MMFAARRIIAVELRRCVGQQKSMVLTGGLKAGSQCMEQRRPFVFTCTLYTKLAGRKHPVVPKLLPYYNPLCLLRGFQQNANVMVYRPCFIGTGC